jgi:RecB family exonuclease
MQMQLSQSEIGTWARCPRKWFLEYYLGYRGTGEAATGNMQLGTRVHTALEAYYGYQLEPVSVLGLLYSILMSEHPEDEHELKQEMTLAIIMVSGYLEWLAETGADSDLQVVATEADVQVPLPGAPDHVILRARLDQVSIRASDGTLRFMDYKTSDSMSQHETLARNPQFRFYSLVQMLAAGHGEPVPGMQLRPDRPVVMGGQITTLRRVKRTGASKPPYYARNDFRYNMDQLSSTLDRTRQIALEIMNARGNLDAAYQHGGPLDQVNFLQRTLLRPVPIERDCDWRCPFAAGLCDAMDDGSDWPGILVSSGKYTQADPYARYSQDPLREIREKISGL